MSTFFQLTPRDPLVARDGRPFGAGQGRRMRGMDWPLPSVVAGSFRTALVKGITGLNFSGDIPQRLKQIAVAGVFPVTTGESRPEEMYLPAPSDAVAEMLENERGNRTVHRAVPQEMGAIGGGCDLPSSGLQPVMLPPSVRDFKPAALPAWWPMAEYARWLVGEEVHLNSTFLGNPGQEVRDHIYLDPQRGAAADGEIFSSTGLNVAFIPRFVETPGHVSTSFRDRFAQLTLSARVEIPDPETELRIEPDFRIWHPLGGERRLVHWQQQGDGNLWKCPARVGQALEQATQIRMVLATPAIFAHGWRPGWLDHRLEGTPPGSKVRLQLVGVCNGRWRAVSGWSLDHTKGQYPGPKPIRRMVPAGSVYFFRCQKPGDAATLPQQWLQSVSDDPQERLDGFGLAVWGTW